MTNYHIISFISENWEMFPRVPHYTTMSKYKKILCIELPLTIFDLVFRPTKIWKQRSKFKNRLRKINENLFVYTPVTIAPFGLSYRSKFLSLLNRFFITRGLQRIIHNLQINKYICIVCAPHLACLVDILNPLARVYEVADEWSASEKCPNLDKLDNASKLLEKEEMKILEGVNIVFATSKELYKTKRQYNKNVHFIPNGVDLNHFWSNNDKELPDITAIPKPRIGYVGHINTFLDFEWLDYAAVKHPEWSFVFLGIFDDERTLNRDPDFLQFIKRKNLFMLGWKKYEDLPSYMREIDVFLLPRKINDWTQNSNPNKIYQYLCIGKPIVVSKFSSVEPYNGSIYIADNKYAFLEYIEKSVHENDNTLKEQRIELARQNDLNLRAKEKINILNEYLKKLNN